MPRYGTSTPVMKAKVDLPGHLPNLLSPRHTLQTHQKTPRIDQQGQPYIILPRTYFRRWERPSRASVTSATFHETLTGFERHLDYGSQPTHSRNHNNPYTTERTITYG